MGDPLGMVDPWGLEPSNWRRLFGFFTALGGAVEVVVGLATPPTLVGAVVFLHGLDNIQAGIRQMYSGEEVRTFTSELVEKSARGYGASDGTAYAIGEAVDIAISVTVGITAGGKLPGLGDFPLWPPGGGVTVGIAGGCTAIITTGGAVVAATGGQVLTVLSWFAKVVTAFGDLGPNGGLRDRDTIDRLYDEISQRNRRREDRSRGKDGNGQECSGNGHRDHESANRGPSGDRPGRDSGRNRERNIGIDEEHSRVPKGTGDRQGTH